MGKSSDYEEIYPRSLSGHAVITPPPALLPPRVSLSGNEVTLEPQNAEQHAKELYSAGHDSPEALAIWDYLTYGPWPDVESYTATIRSQSASVDPIFYAIRLNITGSVCGQASFLDNNAQNGVTEIGHIWFGPELQRTRAATEALFLMLCHAFDDLKYRRMQWRCNSLNKKSRTAAKRLGFRFEGIFYNHLIFKGKNRDTAWYSILDTEWTDVRSIIQNWLDQSNFDKNGVPLTSLSEKMQQRAQLDNQNSRESL
jgi:RimJ/RimL family protein N-acetyltransferase